MASTVQENTSTNKVEIAGELDGKLKTLLQLMVSRIPADKKISSGVVLQLLRTKYADTYSEEYIAAQSEFIANTLEELLNNRSSTQLSSLPANTTVSGEKQNGKCNTSNNVNLDEKTDNNGDVNGNESNESDSSSSYSDNEDDEEEEEESDYDNDEEDDEEDAEDESFYSSSNSSDDDGDDDDTDDNKEKEEDDSASLERESKRAKVEEEENVQHLSNTTTTTTENNHDENNKDVHQRCNGMLTCLKKLSYRVRSRESDESEQQYIDNVLVVEFVKHGLDPMRFGKSDIHRYKMKREVELLQQDGASLALDRRQRLGRGYSNIELRNGESGNDVNNAVHETTNPSQSTYTTSKFLDDAEDEEREQK